MKSSDLDLLKLAAKAADLAVRGVLPNGDVDIGADMAMWRPLTDDGDAFRLSVLLEMNVFHTSGRVYAMPSDGDVPDAEAQEDLGKDANAATRRAIVRCAALLVDE